MVFHPEAGWGGLPTRVQKTKIYNLETDEFASTPPFSKKPLAGAISQYKSAREIIWREFFKKTFGGKKIKKPLHKTDRIETNVLLFGGNR